MGAFRRQQIGVAVGMAVGLVATLAGFLWPHLPSVPQETGGRLGFWLGCSSIAASCLLVAIARLARHRFFSPDDIEGGGVTANSHLAALLQTLIQNTLEQLILAIPIYGAWLWLAPADRRGLVLVYTCFFVLGRLLFFAGYSRGARARALGFTLTFYPTVALYLGLLAFVFR